MGRPGRLGSVCGPTDAHGVTTVGWTIQFSTKKNVEQCQMNDSTTDGLTAIQEPLQKV